MLIEHKRMLPSFHVNPMDSLQTPVTVLTVLSVNDQVRDCAAYRGVCPDLSMALKENRDAIVKSVRAGGDKISEDEARKLFPEIEEMKLRYRR